MSLDPKFAAPARMRPTWYRILAGTIMIVIIVALALSISSLNQRHNIDNMHPDSVSPRGAGALGNILRDHGVSIVLAHTSDEVLDGNGTILVWDPSRHLTHYEREQLKTSGRPLVIVSSDGEDASDWLDGTIDATPNSSSAGIRPECSVSWVSDLDGIEGVSRGIDKPGCFPTGSGYHLVVEDNVSYFASPELFTNAYLDRAHNAAVAIRATGQTKSLTWLIPIPDLEEPLPAVPPALTGALIGFAAVALWYGFFVRRPAGPLIPEQLPVAVPGAETVRGRARLYERGANYGYAGAALRAGTIHTASGRLGLSPSASPEHVITQIVTATGRDRNEIADLLYGPPPASERDLTDLTHRLNQLTKELTHD